MSISKVHVRAPATVANVGCAFDVLGFALEEPHDEIVASLSDSAGVTISKITSQFGKLPSDPKKNTAGVAVQALLTEIGEKRGINLEIIKGMPSGSGLGSSAASAAGAVFAANELLGRPYTPTQLVQFAMQGEAAACGTAHADNVAPALCGGFALIRGREPLDIVSVNFPSNLFVSVVCPGIELKTEDARKVLKKIVPLDDVTLQFGNVAGLIAGLYSGDLNLIGRSLHDRIVEPARKVLIPGFSEVKEAAIASGALGCGISGSGPSIFAFSDSLVQASKIAASMKEAFQAKSIDSLSYASKINPQGAAVISQ